VGPTNYETRVYPRATAEWSWPWINDLMPFTPLLEPTVSTTWAPTSVDDKDDEIPNEDSQDLVFDDSDLFEANRYPGLDRVEPGARLNYGLRFGGFGESGSLITGLFGQSLRLDDRSALSPNTGLDGRASDYVGRIDFTPHSWLDVRYRFGLDKDGFSFLRNELGARFGPRAVRFDVDYLYLEDDPAVRRERKREEIRAGVSLRLTDSISVRARTRRNLQADRNIFHKFALVYTHPCLTLVVGVEHKNTSQGDALSSTTFKFRVVFLNLGELKAGSKALGGVGNS
jgi:LPS-assembly protein